MELNAEQIKKALECCTVGIGTECEKCPYMLTKFCNDVLKKEVLALINSQEQKIKKLTEENERLRATKYMAYPDGRIEPIPTIESVRADTVRKMQEHIYERLDISVEGYSSEEIKSDVRDMVDQIAKEMLEGL